MRHIRSTAAFFFSLSGQDSLHFHDFSEVHHENPTWWSSRVSNPQKSAGYVTNPRKSAGYVTKFAPHKVLKLFACDKVTFDGVVIRIPASNHVSRDTSKFLA